MIPFTADTPASYPFLPGLFFRAAAYSFSTYDLDRMPRILRDKFFLDALLLASPELWEILAKKAFDWQALSPKEQHTLCKYYNRMSFRPVPFGGFAGFGVTTWADDSPLVLRSLEQATLHILPDEAQRREEGRKARAPLTVNPTLYRYHDEYRFVRSAFGEDGSAVYSLEAVDCDPFYDELLESVRRAAPDAPGLIRLIAGRTGCSLAKAGSYVRFCLEAGMLLDGYANSSILPVTAPVACAAESQPGYGGLELRASHGGPGPEVKEELQRVVRALHCFAAASGPPALAQFVQDFQARFDREKVPLLHALDPDHGIAYGRLGSAGPPMPYGKLDFPDLPAGTPSLDWQQVHQFFFRHLTARQAISGNAPLQLDMSDIRDWEPARPMPPSAAVMFRPVSGGLQVDYAGGATGCALIGRFTAFSPETGALCHQIVQAETAANPDVVFADIGQLSAVHTDNINRRTAIYPYEIPVNVRSGLGDGFVLSPDDLLLSVRNGELILESVSLGKRVIPRLASAYNPAHTRLSFFQLLSDLQHQGIASNLNFDLQRLFPGLSFYPQVRFSRTVISPAKWILRPEQFRAVANAAPEAFRVWAASLDLPRFICLGTADRQLVFDLNERSEIAFFQRCLHGGTAQQITEYLPPGRAMKNEEGALAGQFVAFFANSETIYSATPAESLPYQGVRRDFYPGSEWLYLKLYCTPDSADILLTQLILPFVRSNTAAISKWFFIRYFEQGHHLRLRLLSTPEHANQLLAAFHRQLEQNGRSGLVHHLQVDVYRRELERYGAQQMPLIETLFSAGSELAARMIAFNGGQEGSFFPMEMALRTAHHLTCLFAGEEAAGKFYAHMAERFFRSFRGDKRFRLSLDRKYREFRPRAIAVLSEGGAPRGLKRQFRQFDRAAHAVVTATRALADERRDALLADLIHMQLNRIFTVKQRQQELLTYYFLQKTWLSLSARRQPKRP